MPLKRNDFWRHKLSMKEPSFEGKRRPGRPATGKGVKLDQRVPADLARRIEEYAAREFVSRGDAVRELLERGLVAAETKGDAE